MQTGRLAGTSPHSPPLPPNTHAETHYFYSVLKRDVVRYVWWSVTQDTISSRLRGGVMPFIVTVPSLPKPIACLLRKWSPSFREWERKNFGFGFCSYSSMCTSNYNKWLNPHLHPKYIPPVTMLLSSRGGLPSSPLAFLFLCCSGLLVSGSLVLEPEGKGGLIKRNSNKILMAINYWWGMCMTDWGEMVIGSAHFERMRWRIVFKERVWNLVIKR